MFIEPRKPKSKHRQKLTCKYQEICENYPLLCNKCIYSGKGTKCWYEPSNESDYIIDKSIF